MRASFIHTVRLQLSAAGRTDSLPPHTTTTLNPHVFNSAGVIADAMQVRPHGTADHAPPPQSIKPQSIKVTNNHDVSDKKKKNKAIWKEEHS